MKTVWKTIKHNHALVGAIVTASIILATIFGCEPRTQSLIRPDHKVTRAELNIELETLLATAKIRTEELERQEQLRDLVFQSALAVAEGGKLSIPGLMLAVGNLLGIGAVIDNRRKDAIIKTYKKIETNVANPKTA